MIYNRTVKGLLENITEGLCSENRTITEKIEEYDECWEHTVTMCYTSNIIADVELEIVLSIAKATRRVMYAKQDGDTVLFALTGYEHKKGDEEDGNEW